MKIFLLIICILSLTYGLSEPSILDSEEFIDENRLSLENKKKISQQNIKIDQIKESIEGLRSVVNSLSLKIGQIGQQVNYSDANRLQESDERLKRVEKELEELKKLQEKNYAKIEEALKNLSALIDSINNSYISKDDIELITKLSANTKSQKPKSNAALLKEAIKLYREKKYEKAKSIFLSLAKKGVYKPAQVHYYLGEIAYYQKEYSQAIAYFKKSVSFYDKASYMPTLLLHTAISFERLNDKINAEKFFTLLIKSYPDSDQVKIARKHLAKL